VPGYRQTGWTAPLGRGQAPFPLLSDWPLGIVLGIVDAATFLAAGATISCSLVTNILRIMLTLAD
jgi:hypothetical protein